MKAINGAGAKALESRRRTEILQQRVAESERLAALGRVAAGVAHEIRNPIAAMRLKAENALANGADRTRSTDALQVVVEQVGRMDQLLKNLLRSVQRSEIKRQPVTDIGVSCRPCLPFSRTVGAAANFRGGSGRFASPVDFDTAAVGGALDNLILNAIQNSRDGTPIVLGASIEAGRLRLSVSDAGDGVPRSDPGAFVRTLRNRPSGRNGTGFGDRSRGSRSPSRQRTGSASQRRHDVYPGHPDRAAPMTTVLIVDDEKDLREGLSETVRDLGYKAW